MRRRTVNRTEDMAGGVIRSFMHSSYFSDTQISMDGRAGVPGCISSRCADTVDNIIIFEYADH